MQRWYTYNEKLFKTEQVVGVFGTASDFMRFLSLFSPRSLPDWLLEKGLHVKLLTPSEHRRQKIAGGQRSSPIHPLLETANIPDLEQCTWFIHFLVPQDAFSVLGRIVQGAYPPLQGNTWFGIGLASIIVFLRNSSDITALAEDRATELISHEVWEIANGGTLVSRAILREPKIMGAAENLRLPELAESFPVDLTGQVEEFEASFRDAYGGASGYSPDEVPGLSELFKDVGELISELLWLHSDQKTPPPLGLREYDLKNLLERARLIQQRSDRIVQINSALSYVISQSCFGAPPVTTESALVRRHSLLGIGRAHRALVNLVREIETAFRKVSIVQSIEDKWGTFRKLPGFDCADEFDSAQWESLNLPDRLLGEQAKPDVPKLVYFSGRLGFRESEYSVSAAINSLTSGDGPEWHLSTMTHEMLHAHVRILIQAIFDSVRGDDGEKLNEFRSRLFDRFRKHMLRGAQEDMTLIDSVRSVLLSYCCLVREMGSLTQEPVERVRARNATKFGEMWVPDDDLQLRRLLEEEDRSISEIMVHTLDLFYFYFDNFEPYNRAVWASWRRVPSVLRDVRQYALRMLLACTSLDKGDVVERFARARNQVRESISRLNVDLGGDAILGEANDVLTLPKERGVPRLSREANHPLFQPFYAAVRVVDLARHCFASGRVRAALFHDEVIQSFNADADLDFGYIAGEFSDRRVQSVAEFTASRAKSDSIVLHDTTAVERRTAWLFLACGSLSAPGVRDGSLGSPA